MHTEPPEPEPDARYTTAGAAGTSPTDLASAPVPPPPDGMLWDLVGEVRTLLTLPAALTLQVAHPAVGAGVDEHSVFRTDPWGRAERSLRSLQLWVYGQERAVEEGRRLRRLHRTIQGTDTRGRPYHALTPANYAWVHATGFPVFQYTQRYLGKWPFTPAEERRLYGEWLRVGRVLGIEDQDMPQTVEAFWPYYHRVLTEELEPNVVVRELVSATGSLPPPDRGPRAVRLLLRAAWPMLGPRVGQLRRFVTIGFMPPDARRVLGLPWSPAQERRLRRFSAVVRAMLPRLPERLRYLPAARAARAAHRAQARRTGGVEGP